MKKCIYWLIAASVFSHVRKFINGPLIHLFDRYMYCYNILLHIYFTAFSSLLKQPVQNKNPSSFQWIRYYLLMACCSINVVWTTYLNMLGNSVKYVRQMHNCSNKGHNLLPYKNNGESHERWQTNAPELESATAALRYAPAMINNKNTIFCLFHINLSFVCFI